MPLNWFNSKLVLTLASTILCTCGECCTLLQRDNFRHVDLSYLKEILKATQVSSCLKVCPDKNQVNYKYNRDVREQVEIIRYREKEKNIERKLEQFN